MIGKKILEERSLTGAEAKAILEEKAKKEELNYEQKITLEHLGKFVKLKPEAARSIVEKLVKSNEKIRPELAAKIVDTMPKNEDCVRAIFAKERFTFTKNEIDGILKNLEVRD